MSYCRWSTDDYQCDLYVYDHYDGYISINVAGRRRVPSKPLPPKIPLTKDNVDAYLARDKYIRENCYPEDCEWVNVPEKWAGKSFCIYDHEEAAQLVMQMMQDGVVCPKELPQWLRDQEDLSLADQYGAVD